MTEPLISKADGGLEKDSFALCRQVRVVDRLRIGKKIGTLSAGALAAINLGLAEIPDLEMA